jgi:hypothetical protein
MMEDTEIRVQRFVKKSEEGLYLTVPFEVPEDTEEFRISYEYDRKSAIIDIGLNDSAGRFIGWAGSDRETLQISEVNSSPGFETCEIRPGWWQIILGAYHVPENGIIVTYTVRFASKKVRLLRGDLHMHTVASDGVFTCDQLKAIAKSQNLDFIAITDHNNYAYLRRNFSDDQVTVIPGVEWTHYKGHINLLGSTHPFRSFTANSKGEMLAVLREAKENGALLSVNHPFCPNCGWRFGFDIPFDMVEIWNGALAADANLDCMAWWDSLLQAGRQVPIVGGSDFHRFEAGRTLALPCTFVYARSRSAADILAALRAEHGFVSVSQNGPVIGFVSAVGGDGILPGGELEPETEFIARITALRPGDGIRIIVNGKARMAEPKGDSCELSVRMPGSGYVRFEVIRNIEGIGTGFPVMISNPLYVRRH